MPGFDRALVSSDASPHPPFDGRHCRRRRDGQKVERHPARNEELLIRLVPLLVPFLRFSTPGRETVGDVLAATEATTAITSARNPTPPSNTPFASPPIAREAQRSHPPSPRDQQELVPKRGWYRERPPRSPRCCRGCSVQLLRPVRTEAKDSDLPVRGDARQAGPRVAVAAVIVT